jgi:Reverse transcriptase (RNA-dependent DNA polymerase)
VNTGPHTLNRLIAIVLDSLDFTFSFLGDLIVFSKNLGDHFRHLKIVFNRLKKYNLKLKPKKCNFFLGHKINKNRVQPDERFIVVFKNVVTPTTNKQIKSFFSLTGYLLQTN